MPSDLARRRASGLWLIGASLASGAMTYAFLAILSRGMPVEEYAHFSVFWSLSLVVGFGFFLPLEQETSRLAASGASTGDLLGAATRVGGEIALVGIVLLAACSPFLLRAVGDDWTILGATVAFILVSVIQFAARGGMLADGAIRPYAIALTVDVTLRVVLAGALLAAGVIAAGPAAAIMCASAAAAHFWPYLSRRPHLGGGRALVPEFRSAALLLLVASLCAQILLNAGPIVLSAFSTSPADAGRFLNVFSLARIPLFLVVPLQSVLVPPLARLVESGRRAELRRLLVRGSFVLLAAAIVGAIAGYLLAEPMVSLVFGPEYVLPGQDMALLVVGVVANVGLVLTTQLLVASKRHGQAAVSWLVALGAGALVLLVVGPSTLGVELAFGAGSLAGCAWAAVTAYRDAAAGPPMKAHLSDQQTQEDS